MKTPKLIHILTAIMILPLTGCLMSEAVVKRTEMVANPSNYNGPKARIAIATVGWNVNGSNSGSGMYQSMDQGMMQSTEPSMDAGNNNGSMMHNEWQDLHHTHSESPYSDGLTEQLTVALLQSKHFRILERDQLQQMLSEKRLLNDPGSPVGADLMVIATITGWSPKDSGASGSLGGLTARKASKLIDSITGGFSKSTMSMSVRVVDVRTREVIAATEVQTEAKNVNLGSRLSGMSEHAGLSGDLGTFANTSMEKAIRAAVVDAADYVVANTPQEYLVY